MPLVDGCSTALILSDGRVMIEGLGWMEALHESSMFITIIAFLLVQEWFHDELRDC